MRNDIVIVEEPVAESKAAPPEEEHGRDTHEPTPVAVHESCGSVKGEAENSDAAENGDKQADLIVSAPGFGDLEVGDAAGGEEEDGEDCDDDLDKLAHGFLHMERQRGALTQGHPQDLKLAETQTSIA